MKQPIPWQGEIQGQPYSITCTLKLFGSPCFEINGVPTMVKLSGMSRIFGVDEAIMLDNKEVRLVIEKNKLEVVADGVYLNSGKPYTPRPKWVAVFGILCVMLLFLGGALGGLMGMCGALLCIRVSKTTRPKGVRILLCALITLLTWGLFIVLATGSEATLRGMGVL